VIIFTGMGDVDNGDLPMEDALNDQKRINYLQRHIAVIKDSMEYESLRTSSSFLA
jgi:beta-glucosidase/6-phospho-beta-glucosidase/beta-galactosidase